MTAAKPMTMAKPNAMPTRLIPKPKRTWLAPQATPVRQTQTRTA